MSVIPTVPMTFDRAQCILRFQAKIDACVERTLETKPQLIQISEA
jgi:hypothetical protein